MSGLPEPKLALIISESRSGSTLLSKQINDKLIGVMVPPEVRFDLILNKSNSWFESADSEKIYRLITSRRSLDHLKLTKNELIRLIEQAKNNGNIGSLVMSILYSWANNQMHEPEQLKYLVVKKGVTHLKIWKKVLAHCPHTALVFLVRDPRAVVNSKLNASRVYHPFETLGWSGPALLSLRWSWHIWKTNQAAQEMPCTTVRYEDLITSQALVMQELAEFFNVAVGESKNAYVVPEKERIIHKLVNSGEFRKDRITGWQNELSIPDQKTIEMIAKRPMHEFAYNCVHQISLAEKLFLALRAVVFSIKNVVVHFFNHALVAIRQYKFGQSR